MQTVLEPIKPKATLRQTVVAYAKRHLKQHPREVGGQNRGPWVRLYMKGHEGNDYPWCAGFVSFVLKQACVAHGISLPVVQTFSCDSLAASGKQNACFVGESKVNTESVLAGDIFLCRRTATDWTHTGIVLEVDDQTFDTIEGNTNDEGSREGYEVCQRTRAYKRKDFIALAT